MVAINVLPPSNPMVTTMLNFPEISQQSYQWVNNQLQTGMQSLNQIGQQFLTAAVDTYKHLADGSLTMAARRVARHLSTLAHPNMIVELQDIDSIRRAQPIMQRYIMAQPDIRSIYHRQLCDGYSDTYVDTQPGLIGDDHYDYRRVMNGILQPDPEVKDGWRITEYFDDLLPGDRELEADEQFSILNVWDRVQDAISRKLDPTDIFGGDLGI